MEVRVLVSLRVDRDSLVMTIMMEMVMMMVMVMTIMMVMMVMVMMVTMTMTMEMMVFWSRSEWMAIFCRNQINILSKRITLIIQRNGNGEELDVYRLCRKKETYSSYWYCLQLWHKFS